MINEGIIVKYDFMIKGLGLKALDADIYAIIYSFSVGGGEGFIGTLAYLSERTGYSINSVSKSIKRLEDKGLIAKGISMFCGIKRKTLNIVFVEGIEETNIHGAVEKKKTVNLVVKQADSNDEAKEAIKRVRTFGYRIPLKDDINKRRNIMKEVREIAYGAIIEEQTPIQEPMGLSALNSTIASPREGNKTTAVQRMGDVLQGMGLVENKPKVAPSLEQTTCYASKNDGLDELRDIMNRMNRNRI